MFSLSLLAILRGVWCLVQVMPKVDFFLVFLQIATKMTGVHDQKSIINFDSIVYFQQEVSLGMFLSLNIWA